MMTPLEGVLIATGAAVTVGFVVWVILKVISSRLPGFAPVDAKTRMMDKYMEKTKQGMKD